MQSTETPSDRVSHLYAHIPFCPAKCSYCAFETHVGSLRLMEPYLGALQQEISTHPAAHAGGPLQTVYFGGGTPSMMSPWQTAEIISHIQCEFGLTHECEITLEAHPETVDEAKLAAFRECGVTRVSFGGETLQRAELARLGRSHSPEQIFNVVTWSRNAGFESIALDFMYGLPGQTLMSWEETLRGALSTGVDHLSLYPLSIEPRTVFARRHRDGMLPLPGDDSVAAMYDRACHVLRHAGFVHYETSNWARPDHECRHNTAYWLNRQFFGVGVGAHAYLHPYRTENVSGTKRYIQRIASGESPVVHTEPVGEATRLAETVMLRLRLLRRGVDLKSIRREFGVDLNEVKGSEIDGLEKAGLLYRRGETLMLHEDRALLGNEAFSRFM